MQPRLPDLEPIIVTPIVVKLGGSLMALPDLGERLQTVVRMLCPEKLLIIVGGGAAADEIRRLDARFRLPATQTHWAAIAAMSLNAGVVSRTCGRFPVVADRTSAEKAWQKADAVLLDSRVFLMTVPARNDRALPEDWSVTSDSIAACITLNWPARQLVFCKSCDMTHRPCERSLMLQSHQNPAVPPQHQQDNDQLDAWFPNLLGPLQRAGVSLNWLNLAAGAVHLQSYVPRP